MRKLSELTIVESLKSLPCPATFYATAATLPTHGVSQQYQRESHQECSAQHGDDDRAHGENPVEVGTIVRSGTDRQEQDDSREEPWREQMLTDGWAYVKQHSVYQC